MNEYRTTIALLLSRTSEIKPGLETLTDDARQDAAVLRVACNRYVAEYERQERLSFVADIKPSVSSRDDADDKALLYR
jgi:hypothetical protein